MKKFGQWLKFATVTTLICWVDMPMEMRIVLMITSFIGYITED